MLSFIVSVWWQGDRETWLALCTDEVGDTILKRLSVGATHVERLREMTELENNESYTTGYATVTVMMLLPLLCWEFR